MKRGYLLLFLLILGSLLYAGPNEELLESAMYGDLNLCKSALDRGADLNVRNSDSWSALMLAALNGYIDITRLLLDKGAAIDLESSDGFTALMFASGNGNLDIVKLLLERQANIHHVSLYGESALSQAIYAGDNDLVELLEEKGASRELYNNNRALLEAATADKLEQLETALKNGANINAIDPESGWTALMYAARDGDLEVTAFLLEKGALVDIIDYSDRTAYKIALENGYKELAALIKKYSQTNVRKKREPKKELSGKERWIESEIGLRMRDKPDLSGRKLDIIPYGDPVLLLEESGAEKLIAGRKGRWSKVDWKGRTGWVFGGFLSNAPVKSEKKTVDNGNNEKESASKSQLNSGLLNAAKVGNLKQVEKLLDDGADVNTLDKYGKTSLMLASISGKVEVVQLLLESGADPNIQAKNGGTALIMASFNNRKEIVELLIEHEADVNLADRSGKTALELALKKGYHSIANLLKRAGAR